MPSPRSTVVLSHWVVLLGDSLPPSCEFLVLMCFGHVKMFLAIKSRKASDLGGLKIHTRLSYY